MLTRIAPFSLSPRYKLTSFTKKIESLSKRLKEEPNEMLEEEASKLEIELRQEILLLTQKLDQAEADRAKDKELQKLMAKEQKALEKEIADLKKQYAKGTDWKSMYEEEKERNEKQEKESLAEIQRLEKEVRVVFSIGRRTSDKMVENLGTRVKEKEEKLQMTMDEMESKKQTIIDLEAERQSLRQLLRLSWRLTSQRLRLRLSLVRKKIIGGPLTAKGGDDTEGDKVKSRQAVRVRKSRGRSSGSSS